MKVYKGSKKYFISVRCHRGYCDDIDDGNIKYYRDNSYTFWYRANLVGYNLYPIKLENNPHNDLVLINGSKIVGDRT